jgi:peptidoglycan/LPS O-acetylase OafA/YrhL
MTSVISDVRRRRLLVAAAVVIPFALWSAYLYVSREANVSGTDTYDMWALILSALVGGSMVYLLPVERRLKVAWSLTFVPTVAIAMGFYAFWFLAAVFGEAL